MNKRFFFISAVIFVGIIFSKAVLSQRFAEVRITNPSSGAIVKGIVNINANISVDFPWPVDSRNVTSEFGPRWGRQHQGIDIDGSSAGAPVRAVAGGRVIFAEEGVPGREVDMGDMDML